ncbi:MAG: hypothetical protein P8Y63_04845, partial [Deltaproteobacteria bacterium]
PRKRLQGPGKQLFFSQQFSSSAVFLSSILPWWMAVKPPGSRPGTESEPPPQAFDMLADLLVAGND